LFLAKRGHSGQDCSKHGFSQLHVHHLCLFVTQRAYTALADLPFELQTVFSAQGQQRVNEADDPACRIRGSVAQRIQTCR
jgi:hypothetical protein